MYPDEYWHALYPQSGDYWYSANDVHCAVIKVDKENVYYTGTVVADPEGWDFIIEDIEAVGLRVFRTWALTSGVRVIPGLFDDIREELRYYSH